MTMPLILFRGSQNGLKWVSIAFLLAAGPKFGQENAFLGLFRAEMTTIGILNPKIIVTNDYKQFLAPFDWFCVTFSNF